MPTISAGSSVSLTLLESEQLTISTTGGKGSVTVSPNGGTAVSHVFTGSAEVLNVGPIDDGGKVGITAVGAPIVYRSGSGSLVTLDSTNTSLVSGDGTVLVRPFSPTFKPWNIATFGDSRANTNSTTPPVESASSIQAIRTPMWIAGYMGDAEITRNYGISGDAATGWNLAARTGGKTYLDLGVSDVDAVWIQYGVNDAIALTSAATISAALQALCVEVMKQGRYVLFESINPIASPATNFAAAQVIIDTVNATMAAWLASFQNQAIYIDTATALKSGTYANPLYYNADGLHFIRAGAQVAGRLVAIAARTLMALRPGVFPGPDVISPNLLNLVTPKIFSVAEAGTATLVNTYGQDSSGAYCEYTITPLTLSTGICRVRCESNVNFQTSEVPYFALLGNEVIQGSARMVLDNGSNGAPAAFGIAARQRFYTGSLFKDMGAIPAVVESDFSAVVDVRMITPRVANPTASAVATASVGTGYSMQAYVELQQIGTPVRLRIYNPQLRRIGYSQAVLTAASFAIPASTVAYTNSSQGNQQITVGGGTVTVIAVNGVTTGLVAGAFVLNPADTITLTYSVAPTWGVKQI